MSKEKEDNVKENVMFNYSPSSKRGWTKTVGTLVHRNPGLSLPLSKDISEYLVFKYNVPDEDEYDSVRIYGELKKYQELSKNGYAPAIVYCYSYGIIRCSFDDFMDIYKKTPDEIPSNTHYIIEKLNCDEDLFNIFKPEINSIWSYASSYFYANRDYRTLFLKLKELLTVLATPIENVPGLFLVDMKSGNICSDDDGNLKLIDFDPARLYSIHDRGYATPAVTFMLFQTYLIFYLKNKDITFNVTGISEEDFTEMKEFIYNIEKSEEDNELFYLKGNLTIRETISPFRSLLSYYFQIQEIPEHHRNRIYNEVLSDKDFYNEIAGIKRKRYDNSDPNTDTNPKPNPKTDPNTNPDTDPNISRKKMRAGKRTKKNKKGKRVKKGKKE